MKDWPIRSPPSSRPQILPQLLTTCTCFTEACFFFFAPMLVALSDLKFNNLVILRAKFWYFTIMLFPTKWHFSVLQFKEKNIVANSFFLSWFFWSLPGPTNRLDVGSPLPALWVTISTASSLRTLVEHLIAAYWAKSVMCIIPFNPYHPAIKWVLSSSDEKMYFKSSILSFFCDFSQVLHVFHSLSMSVLHSAVISSFPF